MTLIKQLIIYFFFLFSAGLIAQEKIKYNIKVHVPNKANSYFLCTLLEKKVEIIDTFRMDSLNNVCSVQRKLDFYPKGMYAILRTDRKEKNKNVYCYIVLDKDSTIEISIDSSSIVKVIKSQDNKSFYDYFNATNDYYKRMQKIQRDSSIVKKEDSMMVEQQAVKKIYANLSAQYAQTMIPLLVQMQYLLGEYASRYQFKTPADSISFFEQQKKQFWSRVPFLDERIVTLTTFYDLLDYFSQFYVSQNIDSLQKNFIDKLLPALHTKGKSPVCNFLFNKYGIQSRLPFQRAEELMIHIYDNYVVKNIAEYRTVNLSSSNVLNMYKQILNGKPAPQLEGIDTTNKTISLYNIKSKYTIVAFWDPNCSHCKIGIPLLDSMVNQTPLKNKGIQLIGLKTDGDYGEWIKFINDKKLKNWIHIEETRDLREQLVKKGQTSCLYNYVVNQTPLFFLLDENKKIVAKHFLPKELPNFIR